MSAYVVIVEGGQGSFGDGVPDLPGRVAAGETIDDDQSDGLEAIADADGIPMADVVRQAIDVHIAARRKNKAFQARLRASLARHRRILEKLAE